MSIRSLLAVLAAATGVGCASPPTEPPKHSAEPKIIKDPKTGCSYIAPPPGEENTPRPCLPSGTAGTPRLQ